jgi:hypothetical protein
MGRKREASSNCTSAKRSRTKASASGQAEGATSGQIGDSEAPNGVADAPACEQQTSQLPQIDGISPVSPSTDVHADAPLTSEGVAGSVAISSAHARARR